MIIYKEKKSEQKLEPPALEALPACGKISCVKKLHVNSLVYRLN